MKPAKEKAKELVDEFKILLSANLMYGEDAYEDAKQCAIIAVKFAKKNILNSNGYNKHLKEVKQEIENL
jgi:hypothetical protein